MSLINWLPASFYLLIAVCSSCTETVSQAPEKLPVSVEVVTPEVKTFTYDTLTIPGFFQALIDNHYRDFARQDSAGYNAFCEGNAVDATDTANIKTYHTLNLMHRLFTSRTASDCSRGGILNIPYLWHWIAPNPRHEIFLVSDGSLLKDQRPPRAFRKYNSFADIDRTPALFLQDLFSPEPKYYSLACDTFSTFGWCSEREMTFVCLLDMLGFEGKVVAEGGHSWSEFLVTMNSSRGEPQLFVVTIDNTFDSVNWKPILPEAVAEWKQYVGNTKQARWYNDKAHSREQKHQLAGSYALPKVSSRIEKQVVAYFEWSTNIAP